MEEDLDQSGNEEDSQKLLYRYQFAFLHMQKSFTSLFKIIRLYESKIQFRFLTRWKSRVFNEGFATKIFIFRLRLKTAERKLKIRFRLALQRCFLRIIKAAKSQEYLENLKKRAKKVQESNTRELNVMEKEVVSLKRSQTELENLTKEHGKKETPKLGFDKATLLEKAKLENQALKDEIYEMDKKSFALFKELNLIMDELEESKKKKLKKIKKKSKMVIKGKQYFPMAT